MATYKSGKGQRGGDYRKKDGWSGQRDFNKSGSSSPGPRQSGRSNSPWRSKQDYNKEFRETQHRIYSNHLESEWKKVEQDLQKDQRVTGTVEYVEKTPSDIKDDELFNVELYLKNKKEKQASPD